MQVIKRYVKFYIIGPAFLVCMGTVFGQEEGYVFDRPAAVTVTPLYEHWSIGDSLSVEEASSAVALHIPLTPSFSVSLRSAPYSVRGSEGGRDLATVSGMNDTQFGAMYVLEKARLAFTLGIGLPTGQRELEVDEFSTGLLLSNRIFAFQSPHLGQGLKIHPGVLWAVPISKILAAGIGAAYQYRGAYTPLKDYGEYDPGDEVLALAGLDLKTGEASTASMDISYTHFGTDKLGGEDIFDYGDRLTVNAQFRTAFGHDVLWLFARYRFKTNSELIAGRYVVETDTRLEPNNAELVLGYGLFLSEAVTIGFRAEGRLYEETADPLSGVTLGGIGIMPELRFGAVRIPVRAGVRAGTAKDGISLFSYYAGAGISYQLW